MATEVPNGSSMRSPSLQPRFLSALAAGFALALAAAPAALAARACESANATPGKASNRTIVRATLCVLNAERSRAGLRPPRLNTRLSTVSRRHAEDMARRNYFAHDTLGGGSFLDRIRHSGYLNGAHRWMVGENLAWGSRGNSAPSGVTHPWMNSPGHRANILSPLLPRDRDRRRLRRPRRGSRQAGRDPTTDFGAKG